METQPTNDNDVQTSVKRRAACDECRTKKLKCTGEQPKCSRCVREGIPCVYSPQKQMGRPKKRARTEDDEENERRSASIENRQQIWDSTQAAGLSEAYDVLTPGGSLQPWLLDFDTGFPTESALPPLTPDDSNTSNSPPLLILPPELQNTTQQHTHHKPDQSTALLLDPSLSQDRSTSTTLPDCHNISNPLLPTCACLSTMYLTLSTLQTMDPSFTFPFSLHPLREAMQTASSVLTCDVCPQKFISAMQNTQMIGTLLVTIAERFGKILDAISKEADRANGAGEGKKFRLADLNTSTGHLHTNGIGCAAAFNINLDAWEWRGLAKKVVRAEVYGLGDGEQFAMESGIGSGNEMENWVGEGHERCPYFMGLIDKMGRRQEYWHHRPWPEDFPRNKATGLPIGGKHMPKEDHICLKYVQYSRRLVEGYDWS